MHPPLGNYYPSCQIRIDLPMFTAIKKFLFAVQWRVQPPRKFGCEYRAFFEQFQSEANLNKSVIHNWLCVCLTCCNNHERYAASNNQKPILRSDNNSHFIRKSQPQHAQSLLTGKCPSAREVKKCPGTLPQFVLLPFVYLCYLTYHCISTSRLTCLMFSREFSDANSFLQPLAKKRKHQDEEHVIPHNAGIVKNGRKCIDAIKARFTP